ncbi:MAG: nitroreductase family protein [Bacteroidales bacterium]|nr:nitroreductase family protein [Bacteroidales bacterium]
MGESLINSIIKRRTYYSINNQSSVSDKEIEEIIRLALTHIPSAYNSQSTRIVLLLGKHHAMLWQIVKKTLKKIIEHDSFSATEKKIDGFAAGYGTILFFEDYQIVSDLQKNFPAYAMNFPTFAEHTSAMHQFAIWTLLEENGLGASLQHYNPLIDKEVKLQWHLPDTWKLIAQMPFGTPVNEPAKKEFKPLENRIYVFK